MASIIDAIIRLRDQFTPTLSRVRTQLTETQRVSQRAARDVSRLGDTISSIGETMMIPTAAIGATVAKATQTYMGFEKTMTQAKIRSQSTKEEFEQMMEAAIDYAGTYPASGEEVARVFDMLAAAGFKAGQQIGTVPAILEGAIAAGGDIEGMADVIVKTMSSFHLKGENVEETRRNATKIADIMQTTVNSSRMSMADLGLTMGYLGAPAAAAGASLSELGAAMAVASNAGLDASTVGTSLRAIFLRLAAEPKATAKALAELGVSAGDSVGDFKSLMAVMDELRPKIKDLGTKEQMEIAKNIAGMEASSAFLALINTSEDEFHKLQQEIENSTGASRKAFEEMNESMWGAMKAMESATEELFNVLGQALKPTIVDVMNSIRDFALSVKNFAKENPETVALVIKLAGGFAALTVGMLAAGKAISLFGSFAGFLNPMGLFAARLASLSTAFNTVKNVATLALAPIGRTLVGVLSGLGNVLNAPFRLMINLATNFSGTMATILTRMVTYPGAAVLRVVAAIMSAGSALGSFVGTVISTLGSAGAAIVRFATSPIASIRMLATVGVNALRAIALATASNPVGLALLAIGTAALFVAANWDTFKNVAMVVWNSIQNTVERAKARIDSIFMGLGNAVNRLGQTFTDCWNKITGDSKTSSELMNSIFNTLGWGIGVTFDLIVNVVTTAVEQLAIIIETISGVVEGVCMVIAGIATGNWAMAWDGIKKIATSVMQGIEDTCWNMVSSIKLAIASLTDDEAMAAGVIRQQTARANARAAEKTGVNLNTIEAAQAQSNDYIPGQNAIGTDFWKGGFTWVHEQGPELIDLPTGTRVIPHSSSLKEEYNRGFLDAAKTPDAPREYIAGGAAGAAISESAGSVSPMNEPKRDELGNLSGVDIPEYNVIMPDDDISTRRAKMAAQTKYIKEQDTSGEVAAPGLPASGGGNIERDALGNIQGADIPEHNIIRPEDSISVRRAKQKAQEKAVFAAEETGNATSDTRAAEATGSPNSNIREADKTGRPSSRVQKAEPTGNPSSNVKERTEPPKPSPNITVQIPKLADQIIVREKADIDNIVNQLVYRFQAHAMNRVVHAVR